VKDAAFELKKGEILGLFGLVGAGRTELAKAIFGASDGRVAGSIQINGQEGAPTGPADAIRRRIGMLTEDRKQTGLIEGQPVFANVSAASMDEVCRLSFVRRRMEQDRAHKLTRKLRLNPPNIHANVEAFSGGNQQKVLLARWLATRPDILILDEPTIGVDIGARYELYSAIQAMADDGCAVLMISSDLNEVTQECDRILVMYNGRITGEFPQGASRHELMAAATGERGGPGWSN
jgi:ABC-type sugar transport system ATPase subunit